jgi:excisionase family DNA binding protein
MTQAESIPLDIGARGWVTTAQAGAALGVSGKTVQRWCDLGRLPAVQVENGWRRITPANLERFAATYGLVLNWHAIT